MAGKGKRNSVSRKNGESKNINRKSTMRGTAARKSASKKYSGRNSEGSGSFLSDNKYELIFILISVISIVLLLSNFHLVGPIGEELNRALFGLIGLINWIFPIYIFFASVFMLANIGNRKIRNKVLATAGLLLAFGGIFELASYGDLREVSWGELYALSAKNKNGGGFLGGSLAKIFNIGLAQVGAYLILIAIIIMFVIYLTGKIITSLISSKVNETKETIAEYKNEAILEARAKADERIARRKELREIKRAERERIREERTKEEERLRQEEMDRNRALSEQIIQERIKANLAHRKKSETMTGAEDIGVKETKNEINEDEKLNREEKNINKEVELKEISKEEKAQLSFLIHRAEADKKEEEDEEEPFYLKELENKFGSESDKNFEAADDKLDEEFLKIESEKESLWHSELSSSENVSGIDENEQPEETTFEEDIDEYEELLDNDIKDEYIVEQNSGTTIESTETNWPDEDTGSEKSISEAEESTLKAEKERLLEKKTIVGNKALESDFGSNNISNQQASVENADIKQGINTDNNHTSDENTATSAESIAVSPKPYVFPPKNLLDKANGAEEGISDAELHETARKLQETLRAFGVNVKVTDVSCGPAVTRYELQPEQGVKVSKITALADDIKLNLAAADIRIEAPIPGKAAVGIEVPNKKNLVVHFRDLIENKAFEEHNSKLAFAVGKDIGGQTVLADIAKMPHLLIAGATGSGKSVCINTLIMSILYKAKPGEVKFIMVDPKVVELSVYNGIPHLLLPVVTDPKKAAAALNWAVVEMNRRYKLFAEMGVREIKGFNKKVGKEAPEWMPQIVIIVDELADLMMVSSKEVEESICRLAQLARAAGIHLVIATQRPSVNVITGLIKANVPSRIAFAVSSQVDSRTILDGAGAEKLLGKGDMLFFPSGYPKPVRVQGAFISDNEVSDVAEFIKENNDSLHKASDITEQVNAAQIESIKEGNLYSGEDDGYDEYFDEAGKLIIDKDKASIGMLQRVYRIGFNRAARIRDQLAEAGVVSEEEGTKPRKILMSKEDFEAFAAARHVE